MAKTPYQPPQQSKFGQFVDSLFLLVLVLAALFLPVYFGLAGGGKTTLNLPDASWADLGQNATMAQQWEKLGYTPQTAHELIATRFDYSFSLPALLITAFVVIAYFWLVFRWSAKEYKDVIAERFDR
ncbi:hypothetical protein [Hyphomicrobium sp. NDB2Meth4]|jgi:hypothetical protein|uniref:hypothetical protein n=1 Tax=Hyphomicrobium sp. NDB2Meth4 TaxID=1892846 RepID=UPI00093145A2|nr:hypothetical protein [Hyphomicrobium sp. NDB2Meth4]